jgi:hypothetical protein
MLYVMNINNYKDFYAVYLIGLNEYYVLLI